jgi:hypothetical protein
MKIWENEIRDIEKLYSSFKGQIPDLEMELLTWMGKYNQTDDILVMGVRV